MVVGTTPYKDHTEAYPLDKKTLRKVALRSFLIKGAKNGEVKNAVGYTWAMQPALAKIHSDKSDLSLSLGQALEFNDISDFFSTFVMGIVLSLESQKADPAIIRAIKSSLAETLKGLEHVLLYFIVLPLCHVFASSKLGNVTVKFVVCYAVLLVVLSVLSRFYFINLGYKYGIRLFERIQKREKELKKASEIGGVFALGALATSSASVFKMSGALPDISNTMAGNVLSAYLPIAIILLGFVTMLISHYFLTKKNKSIAFCIHITLVISIIAGIILGSL